MKIAINMTAFKMYRAAYPMWSSASSCHVAVFILVTPTWELGTLSWGPSLVFGEQIRLTAYLSRPLHCLKERSTTPQHLPHFSPVSSAPRGWSIQWMEVGPRWHASCLDQHWWIAGQWEEEQLVSKEEKDQVKKVWKWKLTQRAGKLKNNNSCIKEMSHHHANDLI